jgi:nitrogen fixation/metabolism regulation signal transduction histidine kinase
VVVGVLAGWILGSNGSIYNAIALMVLLAFQFANLVWYVNRVHRRIAYFFDAVQNDDYSLAFPHSKGDKLLNKLNEGLSRINSHIERVKVETIQQEKYFEAMIEHINVGIMSVNSDGFVVNANTTIRRLLGLNQLTHIRQVSAVEGQLAAVIESLDANQEKVIAISIGGVIKTLLVKSSQFSSRDQQLKLISMHDIRKELDEKELDSWLKLIRVLTHEIMNSIAPVTSLSDNLCSYYVREGIPITVGEVNEKLISNTIQGLQVIREQGQGLTRFVESYRSLTRLPKPERTWVLVKSLFEKTILLCKSSICPDGISISFKIEEPNQKLYVDENQISQVLINLIKNSAEALQGLPNPRIELCSRTNHRAQVEISVTDNGPGIPAELIDEIFVPFFTTRTNGSGIGLSLSRQIMRAHSGRITCKSIPGKETVFTMGF